MSAMDPGMSVDPGTALDDQYLASFGRDAAVGCFTAAAPFVLPRQAPVLLKTPRGLEVGRILGPATIRQARLVGAHVHGELVRPITADDDSTLLQMASLASHLLAEAEQLAAESDMPLSLLDADVFFDLRHAVVQVLHPNPDSLSDFATRLSERVGLEVRLTSLGGQSTLDDHGCGKPDCGQGSHGEGGCTSCSTGGCSTGCGSGPVDLAPYFAHLREKMEANHRIPLV